MYVSSAFHSKGKKRATSIGWKTRQLCSSPQRHKHPFLTAPIYKNTKRKFHPNAQLDCIVFVFFKTIHIPQGATKLTAYCFLPLLIKPLELVYSAWEFEFTGSLVSTLAAQLEKLHKAHYLQRHMLHQNCLWLFIIESDNIYVSENMDFCNAFSVETVIIVLWFSKTKYLLGKTLLFCKRADKSLFIINVFSQISKWMVLNRFSFSLFANDL